MDSAPIYLMSCLEEKIGKQHQILFFIKNKIKTSNVYFIITRTSSIINHFIYIRLIKWFISAEKGTFSSNFMFGSISFCTIIKAKQIIMVTKHVFAKTN